MELSKRIRIEKEEVENSTEELLIQFDDPPGPSPARLVGPLYDLDVPLRSLQNDLQDKVSDLEVGGVYSQAYTGESYAILWVVLSGVAGGFLGAVGKDIWNALKKACRKIMERNSARRNVVEIGLEFDDLDVIFHYESRDGSKISDMLNDADSILEEIKNTLSHRGNIIGNVKTLELRRQCDGSFVCVLYAYKRCRKMIETRRKKEGP
jgi:hypothetical protein